MNIKKLSLALSLSLFAALTLNAQKEIPDSARELLFDKQGALTRVVATEEEANMKIIDQNPLLDDVPWRKVVLRVIDLREEQNKPLYYPAENIQEDTQKNLFAILFYNFLTGKLIGYKEGNEQTFVPRFIEANALSVTTQDTSKRFDHLTDDIYDGTNGNYFENQEYYAMINRTTQSCIKYYIQEAWYFDKHTSRMRSKILAIAPVFDIAYNEDLKAYNLPDPNNYTTEEFEEYQKKPSGVWFWFPYDKVRPFLQQEYIKQTGRNTKQLLNFDDFLTQRQFYSYIIRDYDLLEREVDTELEKVFNDDADPEKVIRIQERQARIEAEILDFEQDLWNY